MDPRPEGCRNDRGQSLVEVALCLPLLLAILVGIADVASIYRRTIAVTNSAREAAMLAVRDPDADLPAIVQRACDEIGSEAGAPCPPELSVTASPVPSRGRAVTVEVVYTFTPMSLTLVERLLPSTQLQLRASAHFPGFGR
ncbi:MAG: pilus assembly protein [Chloroflexota bacterium]|nr:pilus assembly protein [Chloroflexota bacterium]MDE3102825.1 pilus assembly protein [Chloroflexota bacterium]